MKGKFLKLNKACSEKWENMKPNEKGSFCDICSKNVIDFTQLSQLEISEKIKESKGNICARLTKEQLNTPLVDFEIQKKYHLPYGNIAASLLIASTLAIGQTSCVDNATAQTEITQTTTAASKLDSKPKKSKITPTKPDGFVVFNGKVNVEHDGTPVKNAKITFVSVQKILTAYSLEDGSFSLEIPSELIDDDNVIRVTYDELKTDEGEKILYGYNTEDYILSKKEINSNYTIEATPLVMVLGGIGHYVEKHPVVIHNGKKVDYKEFIKAQRGKKSSCSLENKSFYYFESKIAMAIYGKEAKDGLYILIDTPKK